jgi:hypothetical protein
MPLIMLDVISQGPVTYTAYHYASDGQQRLVPIWGLPEARDIMRRCEPQLRDHNHDCMAHPSTVDGEDGIQIYHVQMYRYVD